VPQPEDLASLIGTPGNGLPPRTIQRTDRSNEPKGRYIDYWSCLEITSEAQHTKHLKRAEGDNAKLSLEDCLRAPQPSISRGTYNPSAHDHRNKWNSPGQPEVGKDSKKRVVIPIRQPLAEARTS